MELTNNEKTKIVLNKLFSINKNGLSMASVTPEILVIYYDSFNDENFVKKTTLYETTEAVKANINNWKRMTNTILPNAYEKNLILSSIFGCQVEDLLYTNYDNEKVKQIDFDPQFGYKESIKNGNKHAILTINLPKIRDNQGKYFLNNKFFTDSKQKISFRTSSTDGLTLLDRAKTFIDSYSLSITVNELMTNIKTIYRNYISGRTPSTLDSLIMFTKVTSVPLTDLYRCEYDQYKIEINLKNETDLKTRIRARIQSQHIDYVLKEIENQNFDIVSYDDDSICVKKDKFYGIFVFTNSTIYFLNDNYNYIFKYSGMIYFVNSEGFGSFKVEEISKYVPSMRIQFVSNVSCTQEKKETKTKIETEKFENFGKYKLKKIQGNLIIMDSISKEIANAKFVKDGKFEKVILNKQGKDYFGMINKNLLIYPIYEEPIKYSNGIYTVRKDNKYFVLDYNGERIGSNAFEYASIFCEDMIAVCKNEKYGYANENFDLVIDCQYDFASDFQEDVAVVYKNGKAGCINKKGELIIPCEFEEIFKFSEGYAVFRKEERYGYIDKTGKIVIPAIYSDATSCKNGKINMVSCDNYIEKDILSVINKFKR